jgi:hypothetical protein
MKWWQVCEVQLTCTRDFWREMVSDYHFPVNGSREADGDALIFQPRCLHKRVSGGFFAPLAEEMSMKGADRRATAYLLTPSRRNILSHMHSLPHVVANAVRSVASARPVARVGPICRILLFSKSPSGLDVGAAMADAPSPSMT